MWCKIDISSFYPLHSLTFVKSVLFIMGEFLCERENKTKKSITPILKLFNCSILWRTSTVFLFLFCSDLSFRHLAGFCFPVGIFFNVWDLQHRQETSPSIQAPTLGVINSYSNTASYLRVNYEKKKKCFLFLATIPYFHSLSLHFLDNHFNTWKRRSFL